VSWRHELSEEELKTTEPLMERIQKLRAMPKKELSGVQLIRTFIERRVQPLAARAHCMWDYTDRWDSTRVSPDELHEAEIDDSVRAVTNIKKKDVVPKVFGAVALARPSLAPRYAPCLSSMLRISLIWVEKVMYNDCTGYQCGPLLSASTRDG
jgi:hypothetical protein